MVELGEEEMSTQNDPSVLMEELVECLKLLDYEDKFLSTKGFKPLTRAQFALAGRNPSEQFIYFTALASWLLSLNGSQASFNKYNDPGSVANELIVELKRIGIELDFAPNKLRTGYGEGPCMVLLALAKNALQSKKFRYKKPVFPQDGELQGEVIEDDDDDADVIDEMIDSDEGEAAFADAAAPTSYAKEAEESNLDNAPIWSSVDPQEWMLEVERVGPRLKIQGDPAGDLREWRAHLEQTRQFGEKIKKGMPELEGKLQAIADGLSKHLERIVFQEKKINTSMPEITGDFRSQANDLNNVKTQFKQTNERVAELSNQLKNIVDAIEKVSQKIEKEGKKVTDAGPLTAIKEGLKELRTEGKDMELRTAVLSHALFQSKLKEKSNNDYLSY